MKKNRVLLFTAAVIFLSIPTFFRMIRPGLYSMQDFPYFRVVEYTKCLTDFQIPCRWAPDAGAGYGEPVFNFYSHIPFLLASVISILGFSFQFSLKATFAVSLLGSAISMFFLSRKVWKSEWAGIVCSLIYLYAPYRAVNVWVRGALPESFAFIFIPLILLSFEWFLERRKRIYLLSFAGALSLLMLTHNLSVILYAHLIGSWIIVRLVQKSNVKLAAPIILSGVLSVGLSAFYLIPTLLESKYVTLSQTIQGYFDFRAHFVTIPQLFVSRFWGYGGSTWGAEDGLSLSIGQVQWLVAFLVLAVAVALFIMKKTKTEWGYLPFHLVLTGFFYLLLTHNKSAFLWEALSPVMSFIQFPWRFLGPALFSFSLAAGYLVTLSKQRYLAIALCILVIGINISYFRDDIWFNETDQTFLTGEKWHISTIASIGDYWTPTGPIPQGNEQFEGIAPLSKTSNRQIFTYERQNTSNLSFPIMYFPGWEAYVDGQSKVVSSDNRGFLSIPIDKSAGEVEFIFTNTPVRSYANTISLLSLVLLLCIIKYDRYIVKLKK